MSEEMFAKPCDICGLRPAVLMFRTYNGEHFGDEGLCPQCALERFARDGGASGVTHPEVLNSINEMRQILTDIASHLRRMAQEEPSSKSASQSCSVCGHSAEEIQRIGNVGCPVCYEQFAPLIRERLSKHAYGAHFRGIVPPRFRKLHFELLEIQKLTVQLNALVRAEKYEQAAKVRNRIKKLSGHHE